MMPVSCRASKGSMKWSLIHVRPMHILLSPMPHCDRRRMVCVCRSYCRQEPEIQKAVDFLDEQQEAGWTLIQRLLSGEQSVAELLSSPVLQVG